jgi:hypothetical protein
MAQLSAGVQVNEIDLSIIVPTVSTAISAFAGQFVKGPINEYLLITNVDDLKLYYGKPTSKNYNDWYQVYNFLQYGDKCYVSRVSDEATMKNAVGELSSDGTTILTAIADLVENEADYELSNVSYPFVDVATSKFKFFARTPGTWGNNIRVVVANESALTKTGGQELYPNSGLILNDMFKDHIDQTNGEIVVVVLDGKTVVERHVVSVNPTAVDSKNGKSIYIEKVINRLSAYIFVKDNEALTYPATSATAVIKDFVLAGGVDGDLTGNFGKAYDVFANLEDIEIDLIIVNEEAHREGATIAGNRKDCIGFMGALRDDVVGIKPAIAIDNMVTYITQTLNIGDAIGKYNAFFGNYKYQYSTELDEYMWVSVAGDVAGIRAMMNTIRNTWDASAGLDFGALKNCIKLAINPNQAQRDILYKNMINPIVSFNGQGTVVWGNKTLQSKPSAFDRINVRGLFNEMERAISKMAKYYVFTNNDVYTRSRFQSTIEPYLRNIKANRGIYDYYVRCDETNNTPYVIDSNQFIADIAIKPARTAEFLVLNFIAVGTGVDFKEIFA